MWIYATCALYALGFGQMALLIQSWDRPVNLRAFAVIVMWPLVSLAATVEALTGMILDKD